MVNAGCQFHADKVVQGQTVGVGCSGQPHNIVAQPASEYGDVVGHRDGLVLFWGGVAQLLGVGTIGPPVTLLEVGLLFRQVDAGRQRLVGPVFQLGDDLLHFRDRMKDVTATGRVGQDSAWAARRALPPSATT